MGGGMGGMGGGMGGAAAGNASAQGSARLRHSADAGRSRDGDILARTKSTFGVRRFIAAFRAVGNDRKVLLECMMMRRPRHHRPKKAAMNRRTPNHLAAYVSP